LDEAACKENLLEITIRVWFDKVDKHSHNNATLLILPFFHSGKLFHAEIFDLIQSL